MTFLNRKVGKEAFFVGLGQISGALGNVVGVRLLSEVLDPAHYGELALLLTLVSLQFLIFFSPVGCAALRLFSIARDEGRQYSFFRATGRLFLTAIFVLVLVAAIISFVFSFTTSNPIAGNKIDYFLFFGAGVFAVIMGISALLDSIQNAARQRQIASWHKGVDPWIRYGGAVIIVNLYGSSGENAFFGMISGALLVCFSQLLFFFTSFRSVLWNSSTDKVIPPRAWGKELLSYGWPYSIWGLSYWLYAASDKWAIANFMTSAEVGLYASLFQIGYGPMILLSGMILQLIQPVVFARAGSGKEIERANNARQLITRTIILLFCASLLGFVIAGIFRESLVRLLLAKEYSSVAPLLPIAVLSGGLFGMAQAAEMLPQIYLQSGALLVPKMMIAVVGMLLNILGAWYGQLWGVALASLITSLLYFGVVYFFFWRKGVSHSPI